MRNHLVKKGILGIGERPRAKVPEKADRKRSRRTSRGITPTADSGP